MPPMRLLNSEERKNQFTFCKSNKRASKKLKRMQCCNLQFQKELSFRGSKLNTKNELQNCLIQYVHGIGNLYCV